MGIGATAGGYRLTLRPAVADDAPLVGVGAIMPEVIAAADKLTELGINAVVICLISPDLLFRSAQGRGSDIASTLFPAASPAHW
ncbi:hypothetical protein [Kribbella catacumbae]|uniref:hypothetical protein n=1 Tax=Kribbella catacumbae TaxID=460086 RepID=UPI0003813375|nr:hypothetical protein [Kribbella catacumbae]